MSLSYEYFVCKNFELLKKVKTELENMLKKDMIKNNSKEWADILKNKLSQIENLYNDKVLEENYKYPHKYLNVKNGVAISAMLTKRQTLLQAEPKRWHEEVTSD